MYTGSKTNDAGLYIENDSDDWGIHVNKNTSNFGLRVTSDGGNAFGIYSDAGVNKINFTGTGNATFVGTVLASNLSGTNTGDGATNYSVGDEIVAAHEHEEVQVDSSNTYKRMGAITIAKNGTLSVKFEAYIVSGTYYWSYVIARNNGTDLDLAAPLNQLISYAYTQGLASGVSAAVHTMTQYDVDVGTLVAGDQVELWMRSSTAGGGQVTGNGQQLRAKKFRISAAAPTIESNAYLHGTTTLSDVAGDERYGGESWSKYLTFDAANSGGGGMVWSKQGATAYNRGILSNHSDLQFVRSTDDGNNGSIIKDMIIEADGDVTIGLPGGTHHNYGGRTLAIGGSRATLSLVSTGTLSTIALSANAATNKDIHLNHSGTDGSLSFYQYSNGGVSMVLDGNGKLGIGTSSPNTKLDVHGTIAAKVGTNGTYSTGVLEISANATPTQIKITTNIPYAGASASTHAHSVTIKGFQYGSANTANIQIGWHVYNNTFYNRTATSSGAWAPAITLAVENNLVVIHLATPGYWPKMYVESMYNAYGGSSHAAGWSWADAAISADASTPNESVNYKANFGNNFVMATDGDVGIGTGSPGRKLHVNSGTTNVTATFESTDGIAAIEFKDPSGTAEIGNTGNSLILMPAGATKMLINDTGNVGIGTTAPVGRLQINGNGNAWNEAPSVRLWDTTNGKGWLVGNVNNYTAGDFYIRTMPSISGSPGSGQQEFIIKHSTGNVGIGTASPGTQLDVIGDIRTSTRYLISTGTTNENMAIGYWDSANARIEAGASHPMLITSYEGNIKLGISGGTTMTVQTGEVGIGTTNPTGALHVFSGTSERLLIGGDVSIKGATDLQIDGTSRRVSFNAGTGTVRTSTANSLYLATNNTTTALTINTNQDATFAEDLTVDGNFTFNGGNVQGNVAYTVDMGDTGTFAENTFYPVTIPVPVGRETELRIEVPLNSGDTPSYATHGSGISLYIKWSTTGNGWGTTYEHRTLYEWRERYTSATLVGGIAQMINGSIEVIYLRGGTKYYFYANRAGLTITPRSATYTNNSQSVSPTTSVVNDPRDAARGNFAAQSVRVQDLVATSKVGVGTTSPEYPIHGFKTNTTSRTTTTDILALGSHHSSVGYNGFGTAIVDYRRSYSESSLHAINRIKFIERGDSTNDWGGAIQFQTKALSSGTAAPVTRMSIDHNGWVGIGTTSPAHKLEVTGGIKLSTSNSRIFFGNAGSTDRRALEGNVDGTLLQVGEGYSKTTLYGFVGIGTTVPAAKLDVAGKAIIGVVNARSTNALTVGYSSADTFTADTDITDANRTLSIVNDTNDTTDTYSSLCFRLSPTTNTSMGDLKFIRTAANENSLIWTTRHGSSFHDRFTIKSNGNVGIGTTNPGEELEVNGEIEARKGVRLGTASANNGTTTLLMRNYDATLVDAGDIQGRIQMTGRYWSGSSSQLVESRIEHGHQISDGNGGSFLQFLTQTGGSGPAIRMRIDKDGQVGIGTTSPTNKLQVVAGNAQVQARFGDANYTAAAIRLGGDNGAGGRLYFEYNGDTSYIDSYGGHGSTQRYRDLSINARELFFKTGAASESMRIDASGNVGIGTDNPVSNLTVVSPSAAGNSIFKFGTSASMTHAGTMEHKAIVGTATSGAWYSIGAIEDSKSAIITIKTAAHSGATLVVNRGYGQSGHSHFQVLTSTLNANGGYANISAVRIHGGGLVDIKLGWTSGPTVEVELSVYGNGFNLADDLRISSGGTGTYPFNVLDIYTFEGGSGHMRIHDKILTGGDIKAGGDVIAYASSDRNFKDNLVKIEAPLDKINKLSGYYFNWNDSQTSYEAGTRDIGVVAQEVEEVIPEIVNTRKDGHKAVRYEKMVALLLEGIKEQQGTIEQLKDRLNKLENK